MDDAFTDSDRGGMWGGEQKDPPARPHANLRLINHKRTGLVFGGFCEDNQSTSAFKL